MVVELRREIIGFRLAQPAHARGVRVREVQMVEQRHLIVEELGVHRPGAVLLLKIRADEFGSENGDDVLEIDLVLVDVGQRHGTQPLVRRRQRAVHGGGDGREPALGDAAPLRAEIKVIVRVQADAPPGTVEGTGHPVGHHPENALPFRKHFPDFVSVHGYDSNRGKVICTLRRCWPW